MASRLLILGAGSAPANNLIHSLKKGDGSLFIVGCHHDRFVLKGSIAHRNYLVPPASKRGYRRALCRIAHSERVDLLIPTSDAAVASISRIRNDLPCRTFLPKDSVIRRCQDKYALTVFLRDREIPTPLTFPIRRLGEIDQLFRRLAPRRLLWCRARRGSGSVGALPVNSPEQVRSWIKYFQDMRRLKAGSFTLSEYLPGRDFCVQSLWKEGRLVLSKMAERLVYLDGGSPSGVSSMPALAKTACEPEVFKVTEGAVRALDARASGVYFIDVKESAGGEPCITEINAGRFATMTNIHDLAGKHNMAVTHVRLALDERIKISTPRDFAKGYYLVRSVDTLPFLIREEQLFEGVEETGAGR